MLDMVRPVRHVKRTTNMGEMIRNLGSEFRAGFRNGLHCYFAPFTAAWLSLRQGGNYFRHVVRIYRENMYFGKKGRKR